LRTIPTAAISLFALAACGGASPLAAVPPTPTGLGLPAPSRSIQLRASFDRDPSAYIGRFVPDSVADGDVDENAAAQTRCSKFIKPKTVDAEQDVDETMYVSRKASASLGLPVVASVSASSDSHDTVRVHYSVTKKMEAEVDADGLAQCCKADSSQCSRRYIGVFVMGTGDVLQTARDSAQVGADLKVPRPISASGDYRASDGSRKKTSFKEVYFAFLTQATGGVQAQAGGGASDCSWCDTLPGSLDGKYFCGVSPEAPDESAARTLAMRAAREQVVQYLGQSISVKSTTTSSALAKALEDHEVVRAVAEGIASQVKDEKWCKERIPTPDGEKVRSKVLAFYPKSAEDDGRKALTDAAKKGGKAK
jgi:hypothetical protein